jgi:hypothetical protein
VSPFISSIECILFNSRSLLNKLDSLSSLLLSKKYSLIAVTETWLSSKVRDSTLISDFAYKLIRKDRKSRVGGGVCFFLRDNVEFVQISCSSSTDLFDVLCIDILSANSPLRVILVYRPPDLSLEQTQLMCDELAVLLSVPHKSILLGDFNLPGIDWGGSGSSSASKTEVVFYDFCLDVDLIQLVTLPTRKNHILDLVFASDPTLITQLAVQPKFSSSCDHLSVTFSIDLSFTTPPSPPSRHLFSKGNYVQFSEFLFSVDWDDTSTCIDPESGKISIDLVYDRFVNTILSGIEHFVPLSSDRCKTSELPPHIQNLIRHKRFLWEKIDELGIRVKYERCEQKIEKLSRQYFKNLERKIVISADKNAFFRYVNSKLKSKPSLPVLRDSDGKYCITGLSKANALAKQFSSVFVEDDGLKPPICSPSIPDTFDHIRFPVEEVYLSLKGLKARFSITPDNLPSVLLKNLATPLAQPLSDIFNLSMFLGEVPQVWKKSFIIPIPKNGYSSNPADFRPISITCQTCRIMERLSAKHINLFFRLNNIIPPQQHGFQKKRSVNTQVLECVNDWTLALSQGKNVDAIYYDFAKAFDTVSLPKLLQKISHYGICGKLFKWLSSFLLGRTSRVRVGDDFSVEFPVKSGVPQGSCLGPLLFILYCAEISLIIRNCILSMFADDAKLYFVFPKKGTSFLLQIDSDIFVDWAKTWQLSLAINKCSVLHMGKDNPNSPYFINGTQLPISPSSVRDLGILVKNDLSFDDHIANVCRNANNCMFSVLRSIKCHDQFVLLRAFTTYVRPLLEFASSVFNPYLVYEIEALEKVQQDFTRILFYRCNPQLNAQSLPSYLERLSQLGIETLELRRLKADLTLTYKLLRGEMGNKDKLFQMRESRTRGPPVKFVREAAPPGHSQPNYRHHFFSNRMASLYHSLPEEVYEAKSIDSFKRRLSSLDFSANSSFGEKVNLRFVVN